MRILNLMFSPGLGGIEQVFADYHLLLERGGVEARSLIRRGGAAAALLEASGLRYDSLPLLGSWDVLAILRLRRHIRAFRPDLILCHGNRALQLAHRARGGAPLVFITHNHRLQHVTLADAVLTVSARLRREVTALGFDESRVFHIPNSIDCAVMARPRAGRANPPVIGALGRMVHKKGFHVLLESLARLRGRGVAFRCVIGGDGEERPRLERQAAALGLGGEVSFCGWVEDKERFLASLDVFCLPSLHEPFGVVVLEAMRAGVPVVSTASEGPSEILEDGRTALLAPPGDSEALAGALAAMLNADGAACAAAAQQVLAARYAQDVVGAQLIDALHHICPLPKPAVLAQP